MELAYNDPTFGLNTEAQFNGNISAIRWTDDHYNEMSAYVFAYDHVNRLNLADHQKYVTNWDDTQSEFDLDTVAYDANGNIMKLRRYRDGNTLMDDMEYTYYHGNTSNQLHSVTDYGEIDQGFLDYDNTVDYTYDSNGNLARDYNKGINKITYNYLNLPQDIIRGTDTISYFYTADGTKIAKLNKDGVEKLYLGNVVYDENTLDYIITSEGMVKIANENTFTYEYYLKDHLGNTRVAFDESGGTVASLTQVNHYYPFGMNINAYSFSSQTDNKYKYNGKELQDDVINGTMLNWYDFHARQYMPDLGRTSTQDPHAENYYSESSYSFLGNNPIVNIDPTGMDWYRAENGNVMWQEGSDEVEGYTNIGAEYTMNIGDGVSITYNQNEASSMTETVLTEDDWSTQQNREGVDCWDASAEMVEESGATPLEGRSNGIETGTESGTSTNYTVNATDNAQSGNDYIDSQINQGKSVLVGVDYAFGKNRNGGTTDHFVAVASRTTNLQTGAKSYSFYEPGTQWKNKGTHSSNVFTTNNVGLLQGTTNYSGNTYTVTHVRKNQ